MFLSWILHILSSISPILSLSAHAISHLPTSQEVDYLPSVKLPRHAEQRRDRLFHFISQGITALREYETEDGSQSYSSAQLLEVSLHADEPTRHASDFTILQLNFRWRNPHTNDLMHINFSNEQGPEDPNFGTWTDEPLLDIWNDEYERYYSEVQELDWGEMIDSGTTLATAIGIIAESRNLVDELLDSEWDRISIVKFVSPREGLGDEIVYEFQEEIWVGVDVREAVAVPRREMESQREMGWMGGID